MSQPNYLTTNFFKENLLAVEMRKTYKAYKRLYKLIYKFFYVGLSILELSKILMYEIWYDYVNSKYDEKAKLWYMDTNSFIVYIITADLYKDIAEDLETRFYTSNYELERPLPKKENEKSNWIKETSNRWINLDKSYYATFNFWKTQIMFKSNYLQKRWGFCNGTVFNHLIHPSFYNIISLN